MSEIDRMSVVMLSLDSSGRVDVGRLVGRLVQHNWVALAEREVRT